MLRSWTRSRASSPQTGAWWTTVDAWGKRKLAFEVDKLTEGDYALIDFHTAPASIAELDRVLHITDPVVRYMLVHREDSD